MQLGSYHWHVFGVGVMWSLSLVDLVFYFVSYALCVLCPFFFCYCFISHHFNNLYMIKRTMQPCFELNAYHMVWLCVILTCLVLAVTNTHTTMTNVWFHVQVMAVHMWCMHTGWQWTCTECMWYHWLIGEPELVLVLVMFSHQCFTWAFITCESLTILHCHTTLMHIVHMVVI